MVQFFCTSRPVETVNIRLKKLRETANPPISIRAMADKLELTHGAYHNYERANGFKKRFLPLELARRIAAILADHGINPDDVMELAGVGTNEPSASSLSMGEEQLIDSFRHLDSNQRRLLLELADQLRDRRRRERLSVPPQPARRVKQIGPANDEAVRNKATA